MLHTLMKNLSKKDAVYLMDAAFRTLHGKSKEDLEAVVDQLRNLFLFDRAFVANVSTRGKIKSTFPPNPMFAGLTFHMPAEFLMQYANEKQFMVDPIAGEILRTGDVVDFRDVQKKYPSVFKNHVYRAFVQEYNIDNGCAYSVRSPDYTDTTAFAFYYNHPNEKTDQRIATIAEFIIPFIAEQYKIFIKPAEKPVRAPLTPRETEVIRWLKEGKTSWEISMILNISERTANFHVANIMHKLNASKRAHAVAIAIQNKLINL